MDNNDIINKNNTNYIFQKKTYHSYQCAAYAIYNLLQNSKVELNFNLNSLIDKCKARKNIGTLVTNFNKTITGVNKLLNCDIRQINKIEISTIKAMLSNNRTIIILFHWYQGALKGNHYALIDKMYTTHGNNKYRVINYSFDKPIHVISERELKSMLIPYSDEHFQLPILWQNSFCVEQVQKA